MLNDDSYGESPVASATESIGATHLDDGILRKSHERVLRQVALIQSLTGGRTDLRYLDLGCGDAPHIVELARRGWSDLTGVDHDDIQVQLANRRLSELGLRANVSCMPLAAAPGVHDVVVGFFGALLCGPQLEPKSELRTVVEKVAPGGVLIVDLINRSFFEDARNCHRWQYDGRTAILESAYLAESGVLRTERLYVSPARGLNHFEYIQRTCGLTEVIQMLSDLGLRSVECYANEDREQAGPGRQRLVAWGWK